MSPDFNAGLKAGKEKGFQVTTPVSDQPLHRPWRSARLSLDSLQVSDRVSPYPLPLSRLPLREACLRVFNGDSGSGL